jgi:hypothetical protein
LRCNQTAAWQPWPKFNKSTISKKQAKTCEQSDSHLYFKVSVPKRKLFVLLLLAEFSNMHRFSLRNTVKVEALLLM